MTEKVKLSGGPEKTVTWIWLDNNGHVKVEYYDFSESAQRLFGNDIAWMEQYFKSYFGIKKWLEENKIDFSTEVEGWA